MKKLLLLIVMAGITNLLSAQTNTRLASGNWNVEAAWSLNVIPTSTHDVVIPTGLAVTVNTTANTKSIELQGDASLTINSNLSFTNASTFGTNTTVNWSSGSLTGGGILTTEGIVNLIGAGSKYITGTTTLNNIGLINVLDETQWYLSNSVINNMTDGIIDFQSNSSITYTGSSSHIINNYGLIKKTTTEGTTSFIAQLINHNGTIQVETGTLTLNNANTTLDSGTYNVSEDGSLNWNSTVFMTGTLTGELTGGINWNGNVSVAEDTTATFNFTGANAVRWTAGSLVGGGTLENLSKINLTTATAKYITGATTLNNIGLINVLDGTQWYLSNSVINNMTDGIIDFQS
ncbi:MAG: hypothetical protein RBR78_01010, partial [Flavobacteriaceae bacterium]|nr:hypothetical protein [Flavobacteriaceae bacterium]